MSNQKPAIVCVDDQREVLSSLLRDLSPLSDDFEILECESADEALGVLDDLDESGSPIALVISDHVMPGTSGVELLTRIHHDDRFEKVRMLLLTGLATHEDTIRAINEAHIDGYVAKPWDPQQIIAKVKPLLTHFVFDADLDFREFEGSLDPDVILERSR